MKALALALASACLLAIGASRADAATGRSTIVVTSGGSGVLRGAGKILFDPDGTPYPYIVFAISTR